MSLALRKVAQVNLDGQPSTGSETSFAQYAHKPLQDVDEIRLLCIEPGPWESDLQCTLSHHRLPECPPFEALSYVWGSEEKPCKIGCGGSGALAVTRNCFAAIKRLRRLGSLVVWIDAVCIDQENNLERGHQVKNMPRIYKTAAKVLVYLGEAEDHGEEAMEILRFYKWFQPSHPDMMIPLRQLMQRSWFERIWVLQEVNKARSVAVICGDHVIPWDPCFRLLVKWGPESFVAKGIPYILHMRGRDGNSVQPQDLFDLLDNTRSYKCTDPRDRVFALLSMSSEDSRRVIEPDYTVTVEDVYEKVAAHYLKNCMGFDVLSMVDHGGRAASKPLPSWVPDWGRRLTCTPLAKLICRNPPFAIENDFLNDGSTLKIRGRSIGALHNLGLVFEPDDSGRYKACLEDWCRIFAEQYPGADVASLDPIIHMSESLGKHIELFDRVKPRFRHLTRSAAHTLNRIAELEKEYPSTGSTEFMDSQSHSLELRCCDEFLNRLGDPLFKRQTALRLLSGCSSKFSEVCMELYDVRFQGISYSEIMGNLKRVLFVEIRKWAFYESSPEFGPWTFGPWLPDESRRNCVEGPLLIVRPICQRLRKTDLSKAFSNPPDSSNSTSSPLPTERDETNHCSRGRHLLQRKRKIPSAEEDSEVHQNIRRKQEAIILLVRMRFSIELLQIFSNERINPDRYSKSLKPYERSYQIFRQIMGDNLRLFEEEMRPEETNAQRYMKLVSLIKAERINECCKGRRLFVSGHIAGLVPAGAQRGDVIYLPGVGRFPLLLRKVDDHEVLIGTCYVVGNITSEAGPYHDLTIM